MKVTVVIPTKNPGKTITRVLPAILAQITPWPYEVLVIDSGSTDGCVDYVKGFPRVRLHCIRSEEFGHGRTRNLGISMAQGTFVALITHDALPADAHWLFELVTACEQADDVAGAFGRHRAYADAGPYITRDIDRHFDHFKAMPSVIRLSEGAAVGESRDADLHYFSSNNACIRKSVWEKIPLPDVNFAEDQIWAQQVLGAGYAKAYADAAVVYHSHNFGCIEKCRRSFDEAKAMYELFGYRLCPSLSKLLKRSVRRAWRDILFSAQNGHFIRDFRWIVQAPLQHGATQLGYYLGQRADGLPGWARNLLSRDRRMQYGR